MSMIGLGEMLLVGVLLLVVVGPKRLPRLLRTAGRYYGELRRTADEVRRAFILEADRQDSVERSRHERATTTASTAPTSPTAPGATSTPPRTAAAPDSAAQQPAPDSAAQQPAPDSAAQPAPSSAAPDSAAQPAPSSAAPSAANAAPHPTAPEDEG